jgi:two-component system OmpR family sensor kinase
VSIRLKLTLYWTVLLTAILAVAGAVVLGLFERRQWAALDGALLEEASTSAEDIARDVPSASFIIEALSKERDLGARRRVRLVVTDGKVLIDGGDNGADLPKLDLGSWREAILDGDHGIFRYAIVPLVVGTVPAYLEDGVDASNIRASTARLRRVLLLALPILIALCAAGGYWMAARALSPMATITAELQAIQPRDLSHRLSPPLARDEIGRLIAVVNAMLDRVERASLTERRFAADAAHELRTPLTVLRSGLEIELSRERTADELYAALSAALEEVVRLCRMAEDLLMISRLDGQLAIHPCQVHLDELISELAANLQPMADAKAITLELSAANDVVVNGDVAYLKRMMLNLLDNALKFTPEGGHIAVGVQRDSTNAVLSVKDDGPGIRTAELPMLFQRFYRGTNVGANPGSGLGLSLCREIARLHGGSIIARNGAPRGIEFVVTLPLA